MSQPARPGTLTSNSSDHNITATSRNRETSRRNTWFFPLVKKPGGGGERNKTYLLLLAFRKMSLTVYLSLSFPSAATPAPGDEGGRGTTSARVMNDFNRPIVRSSVRACERK